MKAPENLTRRTALQAIGASAVVSVATASVTAHKGGLKRELAEVRSATADYNDPENAYADDYVVRDGREIIPLDEVVERGHSVCGMGFHFGNRQYFGSTDKTEPAVLVYGVDDDDNLILGAVEYVVPKTGDYGDAPPDLFDHDGGDEEWGTLPTGEERPDLWTLHVWVHNNNPDGVFAPFNPRKQFHPDGCMEPGGH